MEDTTRALTVLAISALLLAPVMNGVLADAAKTADRLFLKDADWQGDPPDELPDDFEGEPPEGEYEGEPPDDLPDDLEGEGQNAPPPCNFEITELVSVYHENPNEDPSSAFSGRANDAFDGTRPFTVEDHHLAVRAQATVVNLTGTISLSVYPENDTDRPLIREENTGSWTTSDTYEFGDNRSRMQGLESGDWMAAFDMKQATYDEFTLTVTVAYCQGADE